MQEGAYAAKMQRHEDIQRRKRRLTTVYRRRRIRFAVAFAAACLVVAGIVIAVTASDTTEQVGEDALLAGGARSSTAPVAASGDRPPFARLGDRNLLLPVAARDATIIAYKAVSDERAVTLTPIGDQANSNAVVRFVRKVFSSEPAMRYYVLKGADGEPTSSVLVGASPGSPVTAPISGVVTGVKEYLLHGRYTDVQIDIRPEKSSGITLSLLFISDPVVSIGEVVTAGKTQLGKVRRCPEELGGTLAVYTHDSGSHVYLQVSEEPVN